MVVEKNREGCEIGLGGMVLYEGEGLAEQAALFKALKDVGELAW